MPAPDCTVRPGVPRRLAAMFYEALLMFAVLAVTFVLPHVLIGAFAHRLAMATLLWAHLFLVLLIYFIGFWSHGGQTLAMKTWRIRLVTRRGLPVRPVQALLRYLLCWPSLGLVGVGIFWALLDRDGQFLHDRIAGTQLVTEKSTA
ncbi:RDD family protein [Propionivibrio sp.]|uniref:RDD family protein n=1 Tax=Propionivibrio sp. TaxID=2212460 RepID=UPI0025D75B2D|nr:RDD family protein [Propionivibrio sp.]MBK7355788.1 RDD family protein [Propionivibrio sp.]MBK8400548.1 RDD family protein [Propionivibrio sp.]MBK8744380.1 RDD family protein [Propionivibrio sp.]MBK8895188.1 RDD family protein [Propionivibrio sp.]MBL0206907.1 RDD family protein [Propionivibrio sp.]